MHQTSCLVICEGDDGVLPSGQLGYMLGHVDLVAHCYVPGQVFSSLGRIIGGIPLRDSANFVRRSIIGVVRTHVIGRSQNEKSIGVLQTCDDQPADVFLYVSSLYQGLNLIAELEALRCVVPPILWNL